MNCSGQEAYKLPLPDFRSIKLTTNKDQNIPDSLDPNSCLTPRAPDINLARCHNFL